MGRHVHAGQPAGPDDPPKGNGHRFPLVAAGEVAVRSRDAQKDGAPPPASPAEVPDYELLDIIGEGGMGVVYAAHQSSIARTVAVKMLKPSAKVREEQRDKFISEAVVTGELDHPNIVPIYDLGANDAGALFYSMKRVKGTPWDKVIHQKHARREPEHPAARGRRGRLRPRPRRDPSRPEARKRDARRLRRSAGDGLGPGADHARRSPTPTPSIQADSLGGTPAYMAPEMARGPVENINKTSDIYLLGAILYEIIGGQPPHSGRDVMQCLMAAVAESHRRASATTAS